MKDARGGIVKKKVDFGLFKGQIYEREKELGRVYACGRTDGYARLNFTLFTNMVSKLQIQAGYI